MTPSIPELAAAIEARFPSLTERGKVVALAAHRALAFGEPVPDYGIAAATRLQISEVREEMAGWPGMFRSESGRIVGFWGLALGETEHRFTVGDTVLYTWCAWDALFLPELLGLDATVSSRCAATGEDIVLRVTPEGIEAPIARDVVVSFPAPSGCDVEGDRVISTFCNHIRFFSTAALGQSWADTSGDGAFVLTLDEAFELGRECNLLRYGDALTPRQSV